MSGFQGDLAEGDNQFAQIVASGRIGSELMNILTAEAIVPGSPPSYQLCKTIYAYHPLGAKMAEAPINMAQSQEREISVATAGEERLIAEFKREWARIGGAGSDGSLISADAIIKNVKVQSRIYGISSLAAGDRRKPDNAGKPVDWDSLWDADLYFSVFDPLNTAGSLVLNQDPNSPDFQKPTGVRAGGREYHPSRVMVVINEMPLYIQWSDSAFGFSGRSVYQRALYPMKTFLQSMITDQMVTQKVGLLIYKAKSPGSIQNNRVLGMFGWRRSQLKAGMTGNVLNIGVEEEIESLNFQNLEGPAAFARGNALKNTAMAASMPAKMLEQEELVEGLAEGTEDAKQIARFVDRLRIEMQPLYAFFDRIVQCRAWSPAFYETLQKDYPEYRKVPYKTAFYSWVNAFKADWPNLLAEPESKKVEVEKTRFESAVAVVEVAAPLIRVPENRAQLLDWLADEVNSRRKLFSAPLNLDTRAEAEFIDMPPEEETDREGEKVEPVTPPFSNRA